jgi:hypothetical protein
VSVGSHAYAWQAYFSANFMAVAHIARRLTWLAAFMPGRHIFRRILCLWRMLLGG